MYRSSSQGWLRTLAASVAHPFLRNYLILDASDWAIDATVAAVSRLTRALDNRPVRTVELASWYEGNGALKTSIGMYPDRASLIADRCKNQWCVVIIRNLEHLGRLGRLALLELMDADYLGLDEANRCRCAGYFFIASLNTSQVEGVSLHVLDRFPIRSLAGRLADDECEERRNSLRRHMEGSGVERRIEASLNEDLLSHLEVRLSASTKWPRLPGSIVESGLSIFSGREGVGLRRLLALLRLSVSLARVDGVDEVGTDHLAEAAGFLQLPISSEFRTSSEVDGHVREHDRRFSSGWRRHFRLFVRQVFGRRKNAHKLRANVEGDVVSSNACAEHYAVEGTVATRKQDGKPSAFNLNSHIYIEDMSLSDAHRPLSTDVRRHPIPDDDDSLGPRVGVRWTPNFDRAALLPTLFAAAPFQRMRHACNPSIPNDQPLFHVQDLRTWRREAVGTDFLGLVVDLTAIPSLARRRDALLPYLRGAYQRRSSVSLVVIGAKISDTGSELCAEIVRARSVLLPELFRKLSKATGLSTPLAHGLKLIETDLRQASSRRGQKPGRCVLVVMTDGRGNVPLSASINGDILGSATQGFEDALSVARQLAKMHSVEKILMYPETDYGMRFTAEFADALSARTEII